MEQCSVVLELHGLGTNYMKFRVLRRAAARILYA
jgi:hypothetical protein